MARFRALHVWLAHRSRREIPLDPPLARGDKGGRAANALIGRLGATQPRSALGLYPGLRGRFPGMLRLAPTTRSRNPEAPAAPSMTQIPSLWLCVRQDASHSNGFRARDGPQP